MPDPESADRYGLCAVGADLRPGTLLGAYRTGLFPMPVRKRSIGWWSPDPRGVLPVDGLRMSRSLRQSVRKYEVRHDTRFREVMQRCGDPRRPHGWITKDFVDAYDELFTMGWVHSVETYLDGVLVGGLYGVLIGRFFAGESMFSTERDASKVALVGLVDRLRSIDVELIDVQWNTEHLTSLGVVDMPRPEYLARLRAAIDRVP
ncbi:MAG: leucyl/phenylalanyl-tRNA--protein transferase [Ilumatobacteraceae bacterium]